MKRYFQLPSVVIWCNKNKFREEWEWN